MTTLITGGTGLIGVRLAAQLPARGEHVALFDRAPAEWRIADLRDGERARLTVVRGDVTSRVDLLEGERDPAGLAASVTDHSLEQELGVRRQFTPLEVGRRHQVEIAQARNRRPVAP